MLTFEGHRVGRLAAASVAVTRSAASVTAPVTDDETPGAEKL
jgi:hypothetical protein